MRIVELEQRGDLHSKRQKGFRQDDLSWCPDLSNPVRTCNVPLEITYLRSSDHGPVWLYSSLTLPNLLCKMEAAVGMHNEKECIYFPSSSESWQRQLTLRSPQLCVPGHHGPDGRCMNPMFRLCPGSPHVGCALNTTAGKLPGDILICCLNPNTFLFSMRRSSSYTPVSFEMLYKLVMGEKVWKVWIWIANQQICSKLDICSFHEPEASNKWMSPSWLGWRHQEIIIPRGRPKFTAIYKTAMEIFLPGPDLWSHRLTAL